MLPTRTPTPTIVATRPIAASLSNLSGLRSILLHQASVDLPDSPDDDVAVLVHCLEAMLMNLKGSLQ
jgi:hypothetical protein